MASSSPPPPRSPRLIFPSSSERVGCPLSVAGYKAVRPTIACREFIQNALDAHAASEKHGPCKVQFQIEPVKTANIPCFKEYSEALDLCLQSWKGKSSVVRYLQSLKEYADRDTVDVLFVTDNGIGFNSNTMSAVLSEGTPEKQEGASGSFGVGHLTAFGLSGLQYILYGSKRADGAILASGHAVLSSHAEKKTKKNVSHHGYLLDEYTSDFFSPFKYCKSKDLAQLGFMKEKLDAIDGSGSVVAVLGFNGFGNHVIAAEEPDLICNLILEAIATDFAIAVLSGRLEVSVNIVIKHETINQDKIMDVLHRKAEDGKKKREATKAKRTLEAIYTYNNKYSTTIQGRLKEDFQDCEIRLRNKSPENDVSIWRNGMLISRDHIKDGIPGKKPLNAVILLSGIEKPRVAHDLVQKAENPEHNKIEKRRLQRTEREELESFFSELEKWLSANASDSGGEQADLDDEILIGGGTVSVSPASRKVIHGREKDGPAAGHVKPKNENTKKPHQRKMGNRIGKADQIPAHVQGKISKPEDALVVRIVPSKGLEHSVMQFFVDGGVDGSCTPASSSEIRKDKLFVVEVEQDSSQKANNGIRNEDGDVVVPILEQGKPLNLKLRFRESVRNLDQSAIMCVLGKVSEKSVLSSEQIK